MKKIISSIPKTIYLLLSIIFFAFIVPIFENGYLKHILFEISYTIMLLSIFSIIDKKIKFLKYFLLFSIFTIWINSIFEYNIIKYLTYTFSTLILVIVTIVMIRQIIKSKNISAKIIIETICGYLLLGIILFFLNSIILWHSPNAISFPNINSTSNVIYYSYVTITTIGYGEIIPVSSAARSLSILFGVISQLYLALIIAFILGKFVNKNN